MKTARLGIAFAIIFLILLIIISNDNQQEQGFSQPDLLLQTYANNLFWSNNSMSILVANDDSIVIWEISDDHHTSKTIVADLADAVTSVAWSPTDQLVAIGYANGQIEVWDIVLQELMWSQILHDKWVRSITWSPDESMIAVSDGNPTSIVTVDTRENLINLQNTTWLEWSADGKLLLARGLNGDLQVIDATSLQPLSRIMYADFVVIHPNTASVAGIFINKVTVWDLVSAQKLMEAKTDHESPVWAVAWSPTGEFLASSSGRFPEESRHESDDNSIRIWNVATGDMSEKLDGHQDAVIQITWKSSGEYLSSYSLDNTICVWSVSAGSLIQTIVLPPNHLSIAFSPNGEKVAMIDAERQVAIWDLQQE